MSTKRPMNHRPMNLDLRTIKFPVTAIVSILHRISGLILFFLIPLALWGLQKSLQSADGFAAVSACLAEPIVKFVIWGFIAALLYHLVAGIRHLLMDLMIGETLKGGKLGAWCVVIISVAAIVIAGWWLW